MSHLDPEQLALLALGEHVASDADRAHLDRCPECVSEIAELTHAATVGRATVDDAELELPRTAVWDRIHAELRLDAGLALDPLRPTRGSGLRHPTATAEPTAAAEPIDAAEPAPLPSRQRTPSRRAWWTLAASVAVIAVAGVGTWAAVSWQRPVTIASAILDPFPAHPGAVGSAEVDEDRSGDRTLTVTLDGAADADEYREVWLIRGDGSALISLGVLDADTGSFAIPENVDLAEYELVDVSFEPVDGDPSHSGDSIVRGPLSFD